MNNNSSGGKAIRGLDVLILGFAFFATYFGAGNLIFPPQLGLNSGSDFLSGLAGLTLSGIFLPIFTLIVIGLNGDVHSITERVGKNTYNVLLAALMLVCTSFPFPVRVRRPSSSASRATCRQHRSSRWSSPISSSASSLLPTRTTSWTAWANT